MKNTNSAFMGIECLNNLNPSSLVFQEEEVYTLPSFYKTIEKFGIQYKTPNENVIHSHNQTFREIKSKNRIEIEHISSDINKKVQYALEVFKDYGISLNIPFMLVLNEFVIRVKNRNNDGHTYYHVYKAADPYFLGKNIICLNKYIFSNNEKFHKEPFNIITYLDMDLIDINMLTRWFEKDENEEGLYDIKTGDLKKPMFIASNQLTDSNKMYYIQLLEFSKHSDYFLQNFTKQNLDTMKEDLLDSFHTFCLNTIVDCLFILAVNYELQCELATRPVIKPEPRKITEKSNNVSKAYKHGSGDERKVINVNEMVIRFSDSKSYKDFRAKVKRKCDYQYSVTGHFRHYKKSGKTIYINPYNKNKDKPFKGKTYVMTEKKEAVE